MRKILLSFAVLSLFVAVTGCGEKSQEVKITTPDGKEMKMEIKK